MSCSSREPRLLKKVISKGKNNKTQKWSRNPECIPGRAGLAAPPAAQEEALKRRRRGGVAGISRFTNTQTTATCWRSRRVCHHAPARCEASWRTETYSAEPGGLRPVVFAAAERRAEPQPGRANIHRTTNRAHSALRSNFSPTSSVA